MLFLLSFLLAASPSLQMTSLAAVETQLDGEWKQEQTSLRTCASPPISEGSLLRVQTKTDGNVHLYAVAVDKKRDYWLLAKREATPARRRSSKIVVIAESSRPKKPSLPSKRRA